MQTWSNKMKLISEHFSDDVEYITEQADDGKKKLQVERCISSSRNKKPKW